jgi:phage shock protein PspC (stress-responsive transcriptional regulator)
VLAGLLGLGTLLYFVAARQMPAADTKEEN